VGAVAAVRFAGSGLARGWSPPLRPLMGLDGTSGPRSRAALMPRRSFWGQRCWTPAAWPPRFPFCRGRFFCRCCWRKPLPRRLAGAISALLRPGMRTGHVPVAGPAHALGRHPFTRGFAPLAGGATPDCPRAPPLPTRGPRLPVFSWPSHVASQRPRYARASCWRPGVPRAQARLCFPGHVVGRGTHTLLRPMRWLLVSTLLPCSGPRLPPERSRRHATPCALPWLGAGPVLPRVCC